MKIEEPGAKTTRRKFLKSAAVLAVCAAIPSEAVTKPTATTDYKSLAFYPDRWAKKGLSTQMYPWIGRRLAFLTTTSDLDLPTMGIFLDRLDSGWALYADLIGAKPRPFKMYNDKPTIAAIPDDSLTCGYGCGYIGATGIEVCGFYNYDYPMVRNHPDEFPHYYFYEMGRNYYLFGNRHSLFITGYAVFMRYVCMDNLHCQDPDIATRKTIERCEELYTQSTMPFLDAFTTVTGLDEKKPRLEIQPSDQPCMYASAMLKLYYDNGGNEWLRRFYAALKCCPREAPKTDKSPLRQCANWLIAASVAAKKDLTPLFVNRWRLPLPTPARQAMAETGWTNPHLDVKSLCQKIDLII